jgi:hypothetical protein
MATSRLAFSSRSRRRLAGSASANHTESAADVSIHQTLRVTPAMAAGVTDHVWEIGEIVDLLG